MSTATPALLELTNLSVHYGAIHAVKDVSFRVLPHQIVSLIGANGAGKTSLLKAISGLLIPSHGRVFWKGQDITALAPHDRVRLRMSHAPEGRGIFLNLSVEENLDLGAWAAPGDARLQEDLDRVYRLFPRMFERRKQNAGTLSGGEQQMLAIGRALMSHPELLLLDEPSLGLAPQVIEKIFELILTIRGDGKTVLLVEQNARQALEIADRALVLETGRIVLEGSAQELLASDSVRKSYLGET